MPTVRVEDRDARNFSKVFAVINRGHINLNNFFADALRYFFTRVGPYTQMRKIFVCFTFFVGEFTKTVIVAESGEVRTDRQVINIHTTPAVLNYDTVITEYFSNSVIGVIKSRISEIALQGYTLVKINELDIRIQGFAPILQLSQNASHI